MRKYNLVFIYVSERFKTKFGVICKAVYKNSKVCYFSRASVLVLAVTLTPAIWTKIELNIPAPACIV